MDLWMHSQEKITVLSHDHVYVVQSDFTFDVSLKKTQAEMLASEHSN